MAMYFTTLICFWKYIILSREGVAYGFWFYGLRIKMVYKILTLCAIFLNFGYGKLLEEKVC